MEEVERLLKNSVEEMEKLLSAKTVVGEPLTVDGNTIVPLLSIGFGFGAGSGSGKGKTDGEGGWQRDRWRWWSQAHCCHHHR